MTDLLGWMDDIANKFLKNQTIFFLRKPVILLIDSSRESGCEVWTCDDDFSLVSFTVFVHRFGPQS